MDPISRRDAGKILLAGYAGLLVDGREAWASTATKNQQPNTINAPETKSTQQSHRDIAIDWG
jgi:hypothetical protein